MTTFGPGRHHRSDAWVAWLAALTNFVAAACLATILRPGLPGMARTAAERDFYIRGHVVLWRVGWLTWHAAALSLLALFVALAIRARRTAPVVSTLALICGGAGLAADLSAEAVLMGLVPSVGRAGFVEAERACLLLTGYVGNGLYSLAGALLTAALYRRLPRAVSIVAIVVWATGFVLSAATLANSVDAEIGATGVLMPAFVAFAVLTARWLRDS